MPRPDAAWSIRPATRTMKNSSCISEKIPQNLTRSSSGRAASAARSSTRSLESSQESSRLISRGPGSTFVSRGIRLGHHRHHHAGAAVTRWLRGGEGPRRSAPPRRRAVRDEPPERAATVRDEPLHGVERSSLSAAARRGARSSVVEQVDEPAPTRRTTTVGQEELPRRAPARPRAAAPGEPLRPDRRTAAARAGCSRSRRSTARAAKRQKRQSPS